MNAGRTASLLTHRPFVRILRSNVGARLGAGLRRGRASTREEQRGPDPNVEFHSLSVDDAAAFVKTWGRRS